MPRKVLFIATSAKAHIAAFHLPYLEWFHREGLETHVAAADDMGGIPIPHCDVFHPIPFCRSPFSFRNLRAYHILKRVLACEHFDIIHCHTPVGGILARLAARKSRKRGTKVIYTAHGFAFYKGAPVRRMLFKLPEKLCARWTDVLITINREDARYAAHALHPARTEWIPGVGVDLTEYARREDLRERTRRTLGLSEDTRMVLSVGRLDKNKNHRTMLRALAALQKEYPEEDIRLFIAGGGAGRQKLERLARRLHIEAQVRFLGYRNDVPALLCAADIFLHLSKAEGLPRAVMEAMAASLPVVASDIRGCRDLVADGAGFLVQPQDVCAAAAALGTLVREKELCSRMGSAGREKAAFFSLETVLPRMEKLYRSVLRKETRVLHVLASSRFFGAEHVVADIIERFHDDPDVSMAYASPGGEIEAALAARRIPYLPLKKLTPRFLKKAARAYQADILHAHDVRASVAASLLARRYRIVSTVHVNHPRMRKKGLRARLFRMAARRFSKIFWGSRTAMTQFAYADSLSDKSEYLPNIVNTPALRRMAREDGGAPSFDAVYLGRLEPQKDPARLLRIFAGVLRLCPDARLGVIGSGSMESVLREYAEDLGISSHVSFVGYRENPYGLLSHARVMLMCSRFEGLPMCSLEACALGVPVVSTKADGLCESVIDGKTGFLSDDDEVLISRAAALISDDALYQKLHTAALEHAEKAFDKASYGSRLRAAYFS